MEQEAPSGPQGGEQAGAPGGGAGGIDQIMQLIMAFADACPDKAAGQNLMQAAQAVMDAMKGGAPKGVPVPAPGGDPNAARPA
jgi:hypothetical protein